MSYKPINTYTGSGNADNAVVFSLGGPNGNAQEQNTYQLGSSAGAMDVFGSGDGTNFLADPLALIDMASTTPATRVIETAPGRHYRVEGRWKAIMVLQKGATAVVNAYLIAVEND